MPGHGGLSATACKENWQGLSWDAKTGSIRRHGPDLTGKNKDELAWKLFEHLKEKCRKLSGCSRNLVINYSSDDEDDRWKEEIDQYPEVCPSPRRLWTHPVADFQRQEEKNSPQSRSREKVLTTSCFRNSNTEEGAIETKIDRSWRRLWGRRWGPRKLASFKFKQNKIIKSLIAYPRNGQWWTFKETHWTSWIEKNTKWETTSSWREASRSSAEDGRSPITAIESFYTSLGAFKRDRLEMSERTIFRIAN